MINVFQPSLNSIELDAIGQVISSHWLGKGPKVTQFESLWAEHIGVNPEQIVSITSATEGLFQAVELLGIGPGDEVIIPSIHFVGAANAVLKAGARPVFCDVSPTTLNVRADDLWRTENKKVKVAMPLNYGGIPYRSNDYFESLDRLTNWCIIEDCAGHPLAKPIGDIAIWSFDAMKIISTGDGGMVYCRDPQLAYKLRQNIYLGQDTISGLTSHSDRWWEFESVRPGRRAIMNDITAAIGIEQLKKLPKFVARRKQIWQQYNEQLAGLDWLTLPPEVPDYVQSSYYFYWVQLDNRDKLARYLRDKNIYTTFRYYPLHRVFKTGQKLPGADRAADTTLLLPLHQGLTSDEVEYICEMVREFNG